LQFSLFLSYFIGTIFITLFDTSMQESKRDRDLLRNIKVAYDKR